MNETRKIPKTGIIIGAVALLVVIIVVSVLLALYFNSKVLEIVSLDILEQTKAGIMYYEETDDGANFTVKNNQARFDFDGLIKSGFSGYAVYSEFRSYQRRDPRQGHDRRDRDGACDRNASLRKLYGDASVLEHNGRQRILRYAELCLSGQPALRKGSQN